MASVFGHAVTAITGTALFPGKVNRLKLGILATLCAVIPDADVVMFRFGYAYEHWLGHRGFSHSLTFAVLFGLLITLLFYKPTSFRSRKGWILFLFFAVITASHGLLDAMTTGGRGVAFFAPFDNERYFLPWRFIQVSPLGAGRFFSDWGIAVLKSEFVYIAVPCAFILICKWVLVRIRRTEG